MLTLWHTYSTVAHMLPTDSSILRDRKWLEARVEEGLTNEQIGQLAGVTSNVVSRALRIANIGRFTLASRQHPVLSNRAWMEARLAEGCTMQVIAQLAYSNVATVSDWIYRHGLREKLQSKTASKTIRRTNHPKNVKYPILHDKVALEAAVQGKSINALAKEIGCSSRAVTKALDRFEIQLPTRWGPSLKEPRKRTHHVYASFTEEIENQVLEALLLGVPAPYIAKAFNIAVSRVHRLAADNDVRRGRGHPSHEDMQKVLQWCATHDSVAHMSETQYTQPSQYTPSSPPQAQPQQAPYAASTPHEVIGGVGRPKGGGKVNNFKRHLQANPGQWFEFPDLVTGGLGESNRNGFSFTVRSRDPQGNYYTRPDGRKAVKVWGRFDPPQG